MLRQFTACLIGLALLVVSPVGVARAVAQEWSVKADVAESCSCDVSCPCNFGSNPTHAQCHATRLIEITEGHYDGVDLAGVSFAVTFLMREWSKIYVDERIDEGQMQAFEALLPAAFGGFHRGMRSLERVPLSVDRTDDRLRFSVPESTVDIELMRGLGGRAVTIDGLPSPAFIDYTQYRSTTHTHTSADDEFSYSGTNGFTSRMEVSGSR